VLGERDGEKVMDIRCILGIHDNVLVKIERWPGVAVFTRGCHRCGKHKKEPRVIKNKEKSDALKLDQMDK
jgi:hypothetical protein